MNEKRITATQVRALCGGISDMTLWRWVAQRSFPSRFTSRGVAIGKKATCSAGLRRSRPITPHEKRAREARGRAKAMSKD
jgi:hypothetical protein